MAYKKYSNNSRVGVYTQWRLIVSLQRKIAHDTMNRMLSDNDYSTQNTLYMAIQRCYDYDIISSEARDLLLKINTNGNIARHEWSRVSEEVMLFDNIVYINSVCNNTNYKSGHTDESCEAELKQILEHRDLIHIMRDNDMCEEGSFMECLNKLHECGLITDEQYQKSKEINKKGCASKHPKSKKSNKKQ
jgi:hypothetical protein